MKKLLLLSALSLITSASFGMELPGAQAAEQTASEMVAQYLTKVQSVKALYKAIDTAKNKEEAEVLLKQYYENPEYESLFYNRHVTRTIKDLLRARFRGIVVCNLYPFWQMRQDEQRSATCLEAMQHPDQSIGRANAQDENNIRKIYNENYRNLLVFPDHCNIIEILDWQVLRNPTLTVIRNANNQVVGFATYQFGKPDIWALHIEMLGIDKQYQRQGYGRRLIQYFADHAKAQGFSRLHLSSAPELVGFYQKQGFTPDIYRIYGIPVMKCKIGNHPILEKNINT